MKLNRSHIPASALGYAIAFMLLVGLVTSGILFISSVNKRLEMNYTLDEHLLLNNYFSLQFGATSPHTGKQQLIHSSGDTTQITRKSWERLTL